MTAPGCVTLSDLYGRLTADLSLEWVNEPVGAAHELTDGARRLNPRQPAPLQVWDTLELDFIAALQGSTVQHDIMHALRRETRAVVLAGSLTLPEALARALDGASIARLASPLPAHELIAALQPSAFAAARRRNWHGVLMDVFGVGVLLSGKSGVGKSELALELLSRGHRLIADDAPELTVTAEGDLEGSCPREIRDFLEVRGLGVLNVRALFGDHAVFERRRVGLLVSLVDPHASGLPKGDRIRGTRQARSILGVSVPEITLPVAIGHNLAVLVETACRDHLLRERGFAADEAFVQRHNAILAEGK